MLNAKCKTQNAKCKMTFVIQIPIYRFISVGEGLDPPGDLQKQITIAVRQSTVISTERSEWRNPFSCKDIYGFLDSVSLRSK